MGQLEHFSAVFDIKQFQKKRNLYLAEAILKEAQSPFYAEITETCRENGISLLGAWLQVLRLKLQAALESVKSKLQK